MKHIVYKRNEDGSVSSQKMGSYEGPKDDSSANRSHLSAEPMAAHFELPEGMDEDCVELVWVEAVEGVEAVEAVQAVEGVEAVEAVEAVEGVEAQPEKWVKEDVEVFEDPSDEAWTYIPAVEAVQAVKEVKAVKGVKAVEAVEAVEAVQAVPAHYELQENADLVLAKRQAMAQANLDTIRGLRQPLLNSADHEINIMEDDGVDATDMRVYRKSLRGCTDSFKKNDGSAKLSCENLVPSEFVFPSKP
jgi:hypothetical protein